MRKALSAVLGLALALAPLTALAQTEAASCAAKRSWPFYGVFGTYDRAALQRGFQIYSTICSNCHSMNLLHYRDLTALGYSADEVKAIAAQKNVPDTDDSGQPTQRPARPYDAFVAPFPNEKAARAANNGALPPDLSLMAKAREGGPDHIFGILTSYREPPKDFQLGQGMNYDPCMAGDQIAMPQPLTADAVSYTDGTKATLDQEAYDVASFLMWAAEPNLEDRHRTGVKVMLFLLVMAGVLYAMKRKIWSDLH
jgi:ubiquinol-cytochrome c reductase cytochrome c1 subunit